MPSHATERPGSVDISLCPMRRHCPMSMQTTLSGIAQESLAQVQHGGDVQDEDILWPDIPGNRSSPYRLVPRSRGPCVDCASYVPVRFCTFGSRVGASYKKRLNIYHWIMALTKTDKCSARHISQASRFVLKFAINPSQYLPRYHAILQPFRNLSCHEPI